MRVRVGLEVQFHFICMFNTVCKVKAYVNQHLDRSVIMKLYILIGSVQKTRRENNIVVLWGFTLNYFFVHQDRTVRFVFLVKHNVFKWLVFTGLCWSLASSYRTKETLGPQPVTRAHSIHMCNLMQVDTNVSSVRLFVSRFWMLMRRGDVRETILDQDWRHVSARPRRTPRTRTHVHNLDVWGGKWAPFSPSGGYN